MKRNKGITLIALVITIIVLLILAGVAIAMLSGENGILKKAAEAKIKTEEEQKNEKESLKNYEYLMKKSSGERCWQYKKDSKGRKTIITDGIMELPIGTYINYDPTKDENGNAIEKIEVSHVGSITETNQILEEGNGYSDQTITNQAATGGWQILGVDESTGEVLIKCVKAIFPNEHKKIFRLEGRLGYLCREKELNKVCSVFGHGRGATGARSINVNDINKITGYNPNNIGEYDPEQKKMGKRYTTDTENGYGEYGAKVKYSWTEIADKIKWKVEESSATNKNGEFTCGEKGFTWYDIENKIWRNSKQDTTRPTDIVTLTNTCYLYYAYTLSEDSSTEGECKGIVENSEEYKTIFSSRYLLNSAYINMHSEVVEYGVYAINSSGGCIFKTYLAASSGGDFNSNAGLGICPIVLLKADVKFEKNEDGTYDIK